MVTEYISEAWKAYRKNFWQLLGATVLFLVIIFALAFVSIVPLMVSIFSSVSGTSIAIESASGTQVKNALFPPISPLTVAAAAAAFLLIIIVAWVLGAGLIRVYADALKGKARLEAMFSTAKKKFWTILAANLIVLLLLIPLYILALAAAVLLSGTASLMFLAYFILLAIPIVLVAVLFSLTDQAIVIGDYKAVDSVKKSFSIVRKNYLQFLGLVVLLVILSLLVSFVPIIGSLINLFLVTPIAGLSYTAFYLRKAAGTRRNVAGRRKRKK